MMLDTIRQQIKKVDYLQYRLKCRIHNLIQDTYRQQFKPQNHEVINQKEIRIAGLRRCGNHAISGWIEEQAKDQGSSYYLNNVLVNENPYRYKYQNLTYFFPQHQWSIDRYQEQAQGKFVKRDCLIYSYEDYSLANIFSPQFEKKHDLYLGKSAQRYDVLIIRDPFNFIASRVKKNFFAVKEKKINLVDLWIEYAKEFLDETNYLKYNKVCINYNAWCQNPEYRCQIAQKLNIKFTDSGFNKVRSFGGGSSFDSQKLDGQASAMNLNNRWQHFLDNRIYLELVNNPQLLAYSQRIFGHIPGTEALIKNS